MNEQKAKVTTPVFKLNQPDDQYKYRPTPQATGAYPYHLNIREVIPGYNQEQMVFHIVGDTGNPGEKETLNGVAAQMTRQYQTTKPGDRPQFLYHLGDVVYHHGEADRFAKQFFKPFELYPGPIFAIAGNHDSDVNPASKVQYATLDAFKTVFCDSQPRHVAFSGNSKRLSMVQPNIYWTLETPLATFIGMHTNIPKFGVVTTEQENWLHEELLNAPTDKMLILCLHHAPYSADINHGSSKQMIKVIENAFDSTGVKPDIVFSGHVHNYQRFCKTYADGAGIPFIVAGAGGFDELHAVAFLSDERFEPLPVADTRLECYCDDQHGFLKVGITKTANNLQLTGTYFSVAADGETVQRDFFTVDKFINNTL